MNRRHIIGLAAICLASFILRVWFTLQTQHWSYDAYFTLRIIDNIAQFGVPPYDDILSYGGRATLISPAFYYILAIPWALFHNEFMLVIISQAFISLLPIAVFLAVRDFGAPGALISAALSAFIPILFSQTLFTLSPITLALPVTFFCLVLFSSDITKETPIIIFSLLILLLALLHSSGILLTVGLITYLAICKMEKIVLPKQELELLFFTTFIFLWIQFLLYKRAFAVHGLAIIWQNIPSEIIARYFADVSISVALVHIGLVPLLGGLFSAYIYLFRIKNKTVYLYGAMATVVAGALWLRIIQPALGFMYLGVCLSILTAPAYSAASTYLRKTRFVWPRLLGIAMMGIFAASMVVPSLYFATTEQRATVPPSTIAALVWLNNRSDTNTTILTGLREGHLVTSVAKRRNMIDDNFILIEDAAERLSDVHTMYTAQFTTNAVELFEKYDINYILLTDATRSQYNISDVPYDDPCISRVYEHNDATVYRQRCELQTTRRRQ